MQNHIKIETKNVQKNIKISLDSTGSRPRK